MNKNKAIQIRAIYTEVEGGFPEHSTAFLLEMTAERVRQTGRIKHDCDCADVADALVQTREYK